MLRLVSLIGPLKGMSWGLGSKSLVVGRARECVIALPDPTVSRRHCEIQVVEERVTIRDLGVVNSTLVNSLPIEGEGLEVGDEVTVGDSVFMLVREDAECSEDSPVLSDEDTVSLGDEDAYYIRADVESLNRRSQPATVSDLAHLFRLSRELGAAKSVDQMFEMVADEAARRLDAGALWITRVLNGGKHVPSFTRTFRDSLEGHALPMELIEGFADRRGVAASAKLDGSRGNPTNPCVYMVAPVFVQDTCIGAISVLKPKNGDGNSELNYLVAMAYSLAPNILSVEYMEQQARDNSALQEHLTEGGALVGKSKVIAEIRELVKRVAPSNLSVFIRGETGVGKEVAARLIHSASSRAAQRFVAVNCPAIPEHLFESELFGHVKGAFTGALSTRSGLIEEANGGTLFLDEVSEISRPLQAKLLRVLEDGEYRRIGEVAERKVDVRVLSATNITTEACLSESGFRSDLYHRLCGFELEILPLRDRAQDILPLAEYFLERCAVATGQERKEISKEAVDTLMAHSWPGNVRELRQAIGRAFVLSAGSILDLDVFRLSANTKAVVPSEGLYGELSTVERDHIFRVLEGVGWVRKEAAKILGIDRDTLRRKIRRYGLESSRRA